MIEEAVRLETYLPLSYRTTKEGDYIRGSAVNAGMVYSLHRSIGFHPMHQGAECPGSADNSLTLADERPGT